MPSQPQQLPHILLAEDDPVSAAFLCASLTAFPAKITHISTLAKALSFTASNVFDLLLLDANLPDGSGIALLQQLRQQGISATALAHTAEYAPAAHGRLLDAGFSAVLKKPIPLEDLHTVLRQYLPAAFLPIWDDQHALRVLGGQQAHVHAMRELFLVELSKQVHDICLASENKNEAELRDILHRLSASCGFVGATQLASAVQQLREQPFCEAALHNFTHAAHTLLATD